MNFRRFRRRWAKSRAAYKQSEEKHARHTVG